MSTSRSELHDPLGIDEAQRSHGVHVRPTREASWTAPAPHGMTKLTTDGSLAPVLIRLAWHASGTYDKDEKTGGSNYATMRFKPESEHGANNGLVSADYAAQSSSLSLPRCARLG